MSGKIEKRTFSGVELRALSNFEISGVAAAYNRKSQNLGGFVERIAPGAFSNSLKNNADVRCLFNHDPNLVLGRTKSGTLALSDSTDGLRFRCQLDRGNSQHADIYSAIKRGDVDQCSFGFTVPDGGDDFCNDGDVDDDGRALALRTLRSVNLLDVSAVVYPAYADGTAVNARSAASGLYALPDYKIRSTTPLTDQQRKAKAARLGNLVKVDDARFAADEAARQESLRQLCKRMEAQAGIFRGTRKIF